MAEKGTTATCQHMVAALRKRLTTQGYALSEGELWTLALDVMAQANTDSANVVSHASTEVAAHPTSPFVRGA